MNFWIMIFSVVVVAIALYTMIDVLRTRMTSTRKMIWFAVVVLVPVLGPAIYFFNKESIATSH